MDNTTTRLRIMLQGYEQQLLSARRLARLHVRSRMTAGLEPEDPDPSIKRRLFVEKTARELYETLVFIGSNNPVVEEIRAEFGKLLGQSVQFAYPSGGRLSIVTEGPNGPQPLSDAEQRRTRHLLWQVTRQKVDQSMLDAPVPIAHPESMENAENDEPVTLL